MIDSYIVYAGVAVLAGLSGAGTMFFLKKKKLVALPTALYRPADVTVSVMPPDQGEKHSRLWVQFLQEACTDIEDRLKAEMPIEEADELRRQLFDKRRQISIHTAMYPDTTHDTEYMQEHVAAAKGVK